MMQRYYISIVLALGFMLYGMSVHADTTREKFMYEQIDRGLCERQNYDLETCECVLENAYDALPDTLKGFIMVMYDLREMYPEKSKRQIESTLEKEYGLTLEDIRSFNRVYDDTVGRSGELCATED